MVQGQGSNGSGTSLVPRHVDPAPPRVADLAAACVAYVEKAVGVKLDYEPETLSVLDHYIESARAEAQQKPEVAAVVAHTAGAYLGEVVRRRYPSWWRAVGDDPRYYRVELEEVYLAVAPVQLISDALARRDDDIRPETDPDEDTPGGIEIEEEDREAVRTRLADLPEVTEAEFHAPSTRLEVIDITVEAIRARRIAAGDSASAALTPRDYDND